MSDFENLSKFRTEASRYVNDFDYSKVVVKKPWGYEYLWYQSPSVAAWMLHLRYGKSTSLHAHIRKRTSLLVVSGQVVCLTLEDRYKLGVGDSIVLEPCVFHTTQAISDDGAFLIEVETPPMKGDLVRLKDNFGREDSGYEQQSHYSDDFSAFVYKPFQNDNENNVQTFGGLNFCLHSIRDSEEALRICSNKLLLIPFLGRMVAGKTVLLETGEAAAPADLNLSALPPFFAPVELFVVDWAQQ
jgi:mannose-6-phosphate isomerase-like protein (cupin superfamily)